MAVYISILSLTGTLVWEYLFLIYTVVKISDKIQIKVSLGYCDTSKSFLMLGKNVLKSKI